MPHRGVNRLMPHRGVNRLMPHRSVNRHMLHRGVNRLMPHSVYSSTEFRKNSSNGKDRQTDRHDGDNSFFSKFC